MKLNIPVSNNTKTKLKEESENRERTINEIARLTLENFVIGWQFKRTNTVNQKIHLRLNDELIIQLSAIAKYQGIKLTQLITQIFENKI